MVPGGSSRFAQESRRSLRNGNDTSYGARLQEIFRRPPIRPNGPGGPGGRNRRLERAAGFSCALPEQVFEGAEGFAGGISRARVDLKTGRPHQIRAQMAAIGCPLVGDHQYGSGPATAPRISPRTGLCCSTWKEQLPGSESYSSFTPIGLRKSLDAPSGCACVFSQTAESKAAARFICVQLLFPGSTARRRSRSGSLRTITRSAC
jgi:hypothetical protein